MTSENQKLAVGVAGGYTEGDETRTRGRRNIRLNTHIFFLFCFIIIILYLAAIQTRDISTSENKKLAEGQRAGTGG